MSMSRDSTERRLGAASDRRYCSPSSPRLQVKTRSAIKSSIRRMPSGQEDEANDHRGTELHSIDQSSGQEGSVIEDGIRVHDVVFAKEHRYRIASPIYQDHRSGIGSQLIRIGPLGDESLLVG